MRENRTCGSEGGDGESRSRPLSEGETQPIRCGETYQVRGSFE